ncbi:MAG: DinB family protein [Phycisphaerae bacterium]|nr:DinB family protein [Phycisphaerae bacterium]NUQ45592.1 DinB family protein [Phycisphaerae bacterium]
MSTPTAPPETQLLLQQLDQAFNRRSWHGPNLRGSIRGLGAEQAAWRPRPKRHCIADIVVHAAYWKYAVRRRLLGEQRGSFAIKGSNWFALPSPWNEAAWRAYVSLLESEHRLLRAAVSGLSPRDLPRAPAGSKVSNVTLIQGIAAHDVYHAGQIQLLKRLQRQ